MGLNIYKAKKGDESIQITDEFHSNDLAGPNQFNAKTFREWCEFDIKRIGPKAFIVEIEDFLGRKVCHIRREP